MDVDEVNPSVDTSDHQNKSENTDPHLDQLRSDMLDRISRSNAHFRHQQRDEPDLEIQEKHKIASDILNTNIPLFLSRFGSYLIPEDLPFFSDHRDTYEVNFYLKEIEKQHDKIRNRKVVNNRRYAAMQELMAGGEYFSEEEMKWRDPWLYFQMIGQYLTDEDIQAKVDKADLRFSSVLLQHMDQLRENAWYEVLKQKEEGQTEEEDESEEEEEKHESQDEKQDPADKEKTKISETEKNILRSEFLQIMQERFMSGNDKTFDYSKVDKNAYYDNLDTLSKDEEEKYFDDDDDGEDNDAMGVTMDDVPRVTTHTDTDKPEQGFSGVVWRKESDDEDYLSFPCEAICETTDATEKFTNMSVSNPESCCSITRDESKLIDMSVLKPDARSIATRDKSGLTDVSVSNTNSCAAITRDESKLVDMSVLKSDASSIVTHEPELTNVSVSKLDASFIALSDKSELSNMSVLKTDLGSAITRDESEL